MVFSIALRQRGRTRATIESLLTPGGSHLESKRFVAASVGPRVVVLIAHYVVLF